jgi:6-pyruvoyltetrahydropterin/6-carboxytetrahydropterin synthase
VIIHTKVKFDSAHRLLKHEGKCKNLHGHTWIAEIWIDGDRKEDGMIEDFGKISKYIDEVFDHRAILHESDPFVIAMQYAHCDVTVMKNHPTVEGIAEKIKKDLNATKVRVWESEENYAEV